MRKICVVTGSRAEYDLLKPLLRLLHADHTVQLQLMVTGGHLDKNQGYTYQRILDDGFKADALVDMEIKGDSRTEVAESMGTCTQKVAKALSQLQPNLLVVLGDRYEMLAVVSAALVMQVPVAHLFGGDITEGAFDDSIRHCISKVSQLHFPTNEPARQRLIRMGENPDMVFNFGTPSLDVIAGLQWMNKSELEKNLNFKFGAKNILVTFHPETMEVDSVKMFRELLAAIEQLPSDTGIIFTKANADPQGHTINGLIEDFVKAHANAAVFTSLGSQRYLSLMREVDAVVGNSSSGIYEAPAVKTATVNIGHRQKGRLFAASVFCCEATSTAISTAIEKAMHFDCNEVSSPYGAPGASEKIYKKLVSFKEYASLTKKVFFDGGQA